MDRTAFFAAVRKSPFGGNLTQGQVDGLGSLVTEWEKAGGGALRHFAYILATAYHETAATMKPIAEYGKGKGKPYGKPGKHGGQIAYGRGYVQLTWDYNYAKADAELGLKGALTGNYELALRPDIAAEILFQGMAKGWFTGKKLSTYIAGDLCDYKNARRIVNGVDKAVLIAGYATAFEAALRAAGASTGPAPSAPKPQPATTTPPVTETAPVAAPESVWLRFFRWLFGVK